MPYFTKQQVAEHCTKDTRIWVTYKGGVYDITDFAEAHPGGSKILLAAGKSIDPFWAMYAAHDTEETHSLLEELRIGNLEITKEMVSDDPADPYRNESWDDRHAALSVKSSKPFNAETPMEVLVDSYNTSNELFYVRNHLPVPKVDPKTYSLEVSGEGVKSVKLTLEDLKTKFKEHSVTATIQCAGNRRSEMSAVKLVRGLSWGASAIGNAKWSGVKLLDVLDYAGVKKDPSIRHIQFEGLDKDLTGDPYGASIPVQKALSESGDVLLAYKMNDQPLPVDHGYPLRVVVPGTVGARNVKWLSRIIVSKEESSSFWQQKDYKVFSPGVTMESANFSLVSAIQEMPVQSAICEPKSGSSLSTDDGSVHVKGYAYSGGGRNVRRVDVTLDDGKTWHEATLLQGQDQAYNHSWAWTLWEADLPLDKVAKKDKIRISCKAVDSSANTQPENVENVWNFRGLGNNAYHSVEVSLNN